MTSHGYNLIETVSGANIADTLTDCLFTLSTANINVSAEGMIGSVNLTNQSQCLWTAISNNAWITIASGNTGNGVVSYSISRNLGLARTGTITIAGLTLTVNQVAGSPRRTRFDFDGDGFADIAVFRPYSGFWHFLKSQTNSYCAVRFGASNDQIAPADYDGDDKTDVAVFRGAVSGMRNFAYFYILNSFDNSFRAVQFAATGDVPVSGDWDGDRKADLAVYRDGSLSAGQSNFTFVRVQFRS